MFQYLLLLESDEDKEFFTEIYQKYRKEMFYTAYNILHNPSDAEDIVHVWNRKIFDKKTSKRESIREEVGNDGKPR